MADGFEYIAELKDEMSGPAHAGKAAVDELTSALKHNENATKAAGAAHGTAGTHVGGLAHFFGELRESLIPEIALGELAAEGIKKLGEVALEAAEKFAELGVEAFKFALEAADLKEETTAAYTALLGSAEEGEATFAKVSAIGEALHVPVAKAHELARTLMLEGLEDQKQVIAGVEAVANLQRAGLEAGATKYQSIIARSLASGHFELTSKLLKGTGVSVERLYADLGKRLHRSTEEIKAELKSGKIAAETGIAALTDAINTGKVAEVAAKKFDIADVFTDLKNSFQRLFQDVDASPLMNALRDFVSIFSDGSASATSMKDVVVAVFNDVIKAIGWAIEQGTLFALEVEIFGLRAYIALFPMIDTLARIKNQFVESGVASSALIPLVEHVADAIIGAATAAGKLVDALKTAGDFAARIGIPGIPSSLTHGGAASAVAEHLTVEHQGTGEAGGTKGVIETPHAAGGMVHEPPPGEFFAAVAPGEMIVPEQFSTRLPDLAPANGNGGGDKTVHVDVGGIQIHGATDLDKMRHLLESEVADVFERVALEMGA